MKITKLTLTVEQIMSLIAVDGYARNTVIDAFQDAIDNPDALAIDQHAQLGSAANGLINAVVKRRDALAASRERRHRKKLETTAARTAMAIADDTIAKQAAAIPPQVDNDVTARARLTAFANPCFLDDKGTSINMFTVKFEPTDTNVNRLLWLKDNFAPTLNMAVQALNSQPDDVLGGNLAVYFYNYCHLVDSYLRPLYDKAVEFHTNPAPRPSHVIVPVFPRPMSLGTV